ncbi:hypothetical protein [Ferriphaselus sp. R-1]|uniref:hypothetical protein n=1 Tax=Ferriphaselus sp. R-1 TaxID=1485544 RepID=UPI0013788A6D|nr:hypothetical protein [Ferriphaselus sp. R-1]
MENRRGVILMRCLLGTASAPLIITIRGLWIEGVLLQTLCFGLLLVYLHFFPKIVQYKQQYILSLVVGLVLSVLAYVFPDLDILLAVVYIATVVILVIPISNELGQMLSE